LSLVPAHRSTARSSSANAPISLGPACHSRRPHQRHCGTGIWRDRDIAAGWRDLETPCASLPTRSPTQPRTAARKAGVLDLRKRMRPRDRLSAGGSRIRTSGPSNQSSSAVLTPDAMAGHIRHVCFSTRTSHKQSARRGWENQGFPQCFEHATGDLDPVRELPYRPAAVFSPHHRPDR
jgi:hypothetical protein